MDEFLTFKTFYSEEEASFYKQFLHESGIESKIVKHRPAILDKVYAGTPMDNEYFLRLRSSDFNAANSIIDTYISTNITSLGKDYYLFSFSDKELLEIVEKRDEWSNQDFLLAKKILADRNITITEKQINSFRSDRFIELEKPVRIDLVVIVLGYLLMLFFGFIGVFMGLMILAAKKNLPDGTRVTAYDESSRMHGRIMLTIGAVILTLTFIALYFYPSLFSFLF